MESARLRHPSDVEIHSAHPSTFSPAGSRREAARAVDPRTGGRTIRGAARVAAFALGGAALDVAHTQSPLYDFNYNTYLLHALARAGLGHLRGDWLAQTTDPFPIVTALSYAAHRLAGPGVFYLLHAVLLGVYSTALLALLGNSNAERWSRAKSIMLGAALVFLHSALFQVILKRFAGGDWASTLQNGVAKQSLLGPVFQPSLFGVFLVVSMAAFVHRRDRLAIAIGAGTVLVHFSYFVTFLALVTGYAAARGLEARTAGWRAALRASARLLLLGGALVLPAVALVAYRFAPTSAESIARARHILVDIRFPHHALPKVWLGPRVAVQGFVVVLALVVARKRQLRVVLGTLALAIVTLTLAQMMTGSRALAILFPWRGSTILVPLATATIAASAIAAIHPRAWGGWGERLAVVVAVLLAAWSVVFGVVRTRGDLIVYREKDPAIPMMRYVQSTALGSDEYVAPVDLRRFRLETGARTFVDWKSHPYRDDEVLVWYERLEAARAFERATGEDACRRAADLRRRFGVTHFVAAAKRGLRCDMLTTRYADAEYVVLEASS